MSRRGFAAAAKGERSPFEIDQRRANGLLPRPRMPRSPAIQKEPPMSPDEEAVLAANAAFYRAFATRDVAAMEALWARATPVACIHPGWQVLNGRENVMASWRGILAGVPPAIQCAQAVARVAGSAAFVVCTE